MATNPLLREPIGWPLLPLPDADGRLDWPDLARSVADTLKAILATAPGERLMRPGFGAGLQNFLHEPNDIGTRRRVQERVSEAIARWEPRVLVDRVEVWADETRPDELRVEAHYRLRRTGAPGRIGVTLGVAR